MSGCKSTNPWRQPISPPKHHCRTDGEAGEERKMEEFFRKHPALYFMFVLIFCFLVVWYIHQPTPAYGVSRSVGHGENGNIGIRVQTSDHESGQDEWIRDPR